MKYKIIKSTEQYNEYCAKLEELIKHEQTNPKFKDEIELVTLLIEKWDADQMTKPDNDPIQLLISLMKENNLKSRDLADILNVSKSLISSILSYRRGLSKENIRILADHFSISQHALNRPYARISKMSERHSS